MRSSPILVVFLLASATDVLGQLKVECKSNPTCGYVQTGTAPVTIALLVKLNGEPAVGAELTFDSDQHRIVPREADANGEASVSWTGTAVRQVPSYVRVTAKASGRSVTKTIEISQGTPGSPYSLVLQPAGGDLQTNFSGWKLRRSLTVGISDGGAAIPKASCERVVVDFSAVGIDEKLTSSAAGALSGGACTASVSWFAGKTVGEGTVRASVKDHPESHAEFTVRSRKIARVILGVSVFWPKEVKRARLDTVRYKVPAATPTGEPRDTLEVFSSTETRSNVFTASPMLGVDIPMWAFDNQWTHHARFSLGVGIPDPRERFFVGVALFQAFVGLPMEGTGIELHVGAMRARSGSTESVKKCADAAETHCSFGVRELDDTRWSFAVMGTLDASSVISSLVSSVTGLGG